MKLSYRFLCFSVGLAALTTVGTADAATSLRGSEREGYSRLVVSGDDVGDYVVKTSEDGTVTIDFSGATTFTAPTMSDLSRVKNVKTDDGAATITFTMPKGADIRDFAIGSRIIFDIYAQETFSTPRAPTPVKAAPQPKATTQKTEPAKAAPPAYVLVPETLMTPKASTQKAARQPTAPQAQKTDLEKAVADDQHIVFLRATQAVNVAAFEIDETLWLVTDNKNRFLTPAITSATPEIFGDIKATQLPDGMAFAMTSPAIDLKRKATGGGLSWNIIHGENIKPNAPVTPITERSANDTRLILPFKTAQNVMRFTHPQSGQNVFVVTVMNAVDAVGAAQSYPEFDLLTSHIGAVIRPKVDDLQVEVTARGVEIFRDTPLNLATKQDLKAAELFKAQHKTKAKDEDAVILKPAASQDDKAAQATDKKKLKTTITAPTSDYIYRFNDWQLGEFGDLRQNENVILAGLPDQQKSARVENILSLGKMFLSHNLAAEALGYFDFAADELPALLQSAEFLALRGAARAFDWKSADGLRDLSHKALTSDDEIKAWRAYTLADLGDWKQAAENLPTSYAVLETYPKPIANRLALSLIEVNLRNGNTAAAQALMTMIEHDSDTLSPFEQASFTYLNGEFARQKGDIAKARQLWTELAESQDDLYRMRGGLALTMLDIVDQDISPYEQIDRLEQLRYAWRGDELEALVKYRLGQAYFADQQFIKGLNIMRDAAATADDDSVLAGQITGDMSRTFSNLYLGDGLKDVSPLDAVALYEEFSELTPIGEEGNAIVQALAEHLVRSDLLGRAAKLLQYQVDHRLSGHDKARVAIRLAAIKLLDEAPQDAVNALGKAEDALRTVSDSTKITASQRKIDMLRIRAYTQNGQYDRALELVTELPKTKETNHLRADIAWQAGLWGEAADALGAVLAAQDIDRTTVTREQADVLLNYAIALSLNNDRLALSNLRQEHLPAMRESYKANQFDVITRPRRNAGLADRDTLLSVVSEVDLFKEFLDGYLSEE